MSVLSDQAEHFAGILTQLVNHTVSNDVQFVVTMLEDENTAWIAPHGTTQVTKPALVPLNADRAPPKLWLSVHYTTSLDDEGDHLSVETSKFGLCVDPLTRNSLLRVEYERGQGSEPDRVERQRRPAAHVRIHGSSTQLGYAQALAGASYRSLERIHFPVGGRRFRPSLEDFIEFLEEEGLVPSVHADWKRHLSESRGDYLQRQLRAAVRRDAVNAADQLRSMGYAVNPPTPS